MNTKLTPNPFSDTQHMPVPEVEPLEPVTFVRPRLQNDPLEPLDVDPATSAALTAVWEQAALDVAQILRAQPC